MILVYTGLFDFNKVLRVSITGKIQFSLSLRIRREPDASINLTNALVLSSWKALRCKLYLFVCSVHVRCKVVDGSSVYNKITAPQPSETRMAASDECIPRFNSAESVRCLFLWRVNLLPYLRRLMTVDIICSVFIISIGFVALLFLRLSCG